MVSWTSLPFSTTSLLGLNGPSVDALVLDGLALQLGDRRPRAGETPVLVNGLPKVVQSCMPLKDLLRQNLDRHHRALDLWAQQAHGSLNPVYRNLPPLSAGAAAIERFVRERLVPRLRAEGAGSMPAPMPAGENLDALTDAAIQSVLATPLWPRWFAFYHNTWHSLAPFSGPRLNGRFHLVWKGQAFIGMTREQWRLAIRQCDRNLEEAVRGGFAWREEQRLQSQALYQDSTYAVLRTPTQHYFVCRRIPPYVVEGWDHRLYLFPAVQVGVPLISLDPEQVLSPLAARVMHAYRHMFSYSSEGGGAICMPMPSTYYPNLYRLPLEEALLRHLEAARMTLCAGYHEGNRGYALHDIQRLNLAAISPQEVRDRGLPVYRFYRK